MPRNVAILNLLLVATNVLSAPLLQDDGLDLEDAQLVEMPEDIKGKQIDDQAFVSHRNNFVDLGRSNREGGRFNPENEREITAFQNQFSFEPARLLHVPKMTASAYKIDGETDILDNADTKGDKSHQHMYPQGHQSSYRTNREDSWLSLRDVHDPVVNDDGSGIDGYSVDSGELPPSMTEISSKERLGPKRRSINNERPMVDILQPTVEIPEAVHQLAVNQMSPQEIYNSNFRRDKNIVPQFHAWNENMDRFGDDTLSRTGYTSLQAGISENDGSDNVAENFMNDLRLLVGNTSNIGGNVPNRRRQVDKSINDVHDSGYLLGNHPAPAITKRNRRNGYETIYTPENVDLYESMDIDFDGHPFEALRNTQGRRRVKEVNEMDEDGLDFMEVHNGRRNAEFSVPKRVPGYSDEFEDIRAKDIEEDALEDQSNNGPLTQGDQGESLFPKYEERRSHKPKLIPIDEPRFYSPAEENHKLVEDTRLRIEQEKREQELRERLKEERALERVERLKEQRRRWKAARLREREHFERLRERQRLKATRDREREREKLMETLKLRERKKQKSSESDLNADTLGLAEPSDISALAIATANAARMLRNMHRMHGTDNTESDSFPESSEKPPWP